MSSADALQCIIRSDPPPTTATTKASHQPVYLRSFKIPTPKPSVAPKVTQALAELGISHTRLVMPTRDNCTALESLLEASTTLVELKKLVDKVEYDIKVLKTRLGNKVGAAAGTGALPTEESEVLPLAPPPADTADAELADGRAQSVVSTRSGRSRKHVCVVRASSPLVCVCSWMMLRCSLDVRVRSRRMTRRQRSQRGQA